MTEVKAIVWAANGNPGCANFLMDLYKIDRRLLEGVLTAIATYPCLRGSNGYRIWNDACERDYLAACRVFDAILRQSLPMKTVHAHMAEGWCAPFKPEEYEGGAQA